MSISDLDWIFSPAGEHASAQKRFADRVPQLQALDEAVANCRARLNPSSSGYQPPQDLSRSRQNVLHFFGMGGIGKSELLYRLQRHAAGLDPPTEHWPTCNYVKSSVPVFYDFRKQLNPTLEGLLLTIRQALANADHKCSAFDLLIARYWALNYPGEQLEAYISKRSALANLNDAAGVSKQIETSVGEAASALLGLGVGVSGESIIRLVKTASTALADYGPRATALRDCGRLQDLLRAPANLEALPYYATALAWDIGRARTGGRKPPLLIVFLDHLEDLDEETERKLQQIVWLLPNALFVTSGRNFLQWANEKATGLFRVGPACWPLLTDGSVEEPRQHRIGPLSQDDAKDFLRHALPDAVLTDAEFAAVTRASGGLPYHLDLMVQHWASIRATRPPSVNDLLAPFPELARRVMRDLDTDQRKVVFAATLFDRFDADLLARVAQVDHGMAIRLLNKPLFQFLGGARLAMALDRTLRSTFLDLAEEGENGWSLQDWSRMAANALSIVVAELNLASPTDKRFWLAQGLQIALAFGLEAEDLVVPAADAVEGAGWDLAWRSEHLRPHTQLPTGWVEDFAEILRIVFARQSRPRTQVIVDLDRTLGRHPRDPRFDLGRYFLAEARRDVGDVQGSARAFESLVAAGSRFEGRSRHGLIHLLRRDGRIRQAMTALEQARAILPAPDRLEGEILWTQAEFDRAEAAFAKGLQRADGDVRSGEASLCAIYQIFASSWEAGSAITREALQAFQAERSDQASSFATGIESLCQLLSLPSDESLLQDRWTSMRTAFAYLQQTSLVCYCDLATVFLAEAGGWARVRTAAFQALEDSSAHASMVYLHEIGGFICDVTTSVPKRADWLDAGVGRRWRAAVQRRAASPPS